eukprot:COSAG03_NODE_8346_length_811_cov_1.002809_1_plen_103_part_01
MGCAAGSTKKQGEDVGAEPPPGMSKMQEMGWRKKQKARGGFSDPLGCMNTLLDAGAEPDRPQSGDGMTPILLALKVKGYDRVLLLVDRGADLTQADGKGETPL